MMFWNKWPDIWWEQIELKKKYPRLVSYPDFREAAQAFAKYESSKKKRHQMAFNDFLMKCGNTDRPYVIVSDVIANNRTNYTYSVSEGAYQAIQRCLSPHSHALLTALWQNMHNSKKYGKK